MAYSRFYNLIEMLAKKIPDYQEHRKEYNEILLQMNDLYNKEVRKTFTTKTGKYINAYFYKSGLTWKIISQKTGIEVNRLHRFVLGKTTPSMAEIEILGKVLRFDVPYCKKLAMFEKLEKGGKADWNTNTFDTSTPAWKNNKNWKDKI